MRDDEAGTLSDLRDERSVGGDSSQAQRQAAMPVNSTLPQIDPSMYQFGSEIARGGMGRVVAARDLRIGRSVVLKELLEPSGAHATRFEREARVTARLQHPAIVPIYEIGRWPDGAPFYAMRMVEGRTLKAAINAATTLEARLALLPSIVTAAEAVAYAHAHRVIHRDLKPSNIMVGDFGETVVIDWGLAKDLGDADASEEDAGPYRTDDVGLTVAGAVVGTPAYMPPEQAAGEAVDERGDVYSLGAILYHVLAGAEPFRAATTEELLALVRTTQPRPISEVVPNTPTDLSSIVAKAMAREPRDRYANAKELATELARYRDGQLVGAHRYSRGELLRRWLREHRLAVFAAGAALVALAIAGTIALVGIVRERDRADSERTTAIEQRAKATDTTLALYEEQGRREILDGDPAKALAYLDEAYRQGRDTPALHVLLAEALDSAGARTPLPCSGPVTNFAISPDQTRVALTCGAVSVYELATAKRVLEIPSKSATQDGYSHDGAMLLTMEGGGAEVWDANTGAHKFSLPTGTILATAWFTHDDKQIVTASTAGWLQVWDATTGAMLKSTALGISQRDFHMAVPFGADRIAVMSASGQVEIWDPLTGVHIATAHGERARWLRARGDTIISCGKTLDVWNAKGELLREVRVARGVILDCYLTPDGKRIVWPVPESPVVEIDDASTGERLLEIVDRTPVLALATNPDGTIYTLNDTNLAMWNGANGELLRRIDSLDPNMHVSHVGTTAILVEYGLAMLVPIGGPMHMFTAPPHERTNGFSPDGARVLTRRDDGTTTLWNTDTGDAVPTEPIHQHTRQSEDAFSFDEQPGSTFTYDSKRLAIVRDRDIAIIDATSGKTLDVFPLGKSLPALEFDRAGQRLLVGAPAPAVWDVASHHNLLGASIADAITISPDGRDALVVDGHALEILDLERGSVRSKLVGAGDSRTSAGFSADGTRIELDLVSGTNGSAVVGIWNVDTGTLLASFTGGGRSLNGARDLLTTNTGGRLELRRFSDGTIVSSVQSALATDSPVPTIPNRSGELGIRGANVRGSIELVDIATGRVLMRRGHLTEAQKQVRGFKGELGGVEVTSLDPAWIGNDAVISGFGGISVWQVRSEHRSPADLDPVVRSSTPWRIKDGRLVVEYSRISGRVTSHGHPVAGARVSVVTTTWHMPYIADTDPNGMYSFDDLPTGEYLIRASAAGKTSPEVDVAVSYTTPRVEDLDVP